MALRADQIEGHAFQLDVELPDDPLLEGFQLLVHRFVELLVLERLFSVVGFGYLGDFEELLV